MTFTSEVNTLTFVEMEKARLRALTHYTITYIDFYKKVEMEKARLRALTHC